MQKRIFVLFLHYFFAVRAEAREKGGAKVKTLTLEDRRIIEKMWADNLKPVQIAAALDISQCTVYTELKRGQELDEQTGEEILDRNFRPAYRAERGEAVYQRNLRNRGRRPKRQPALKGAERS